MGYWSCQRRRRFDPQFFSFQPLLRMSLVFGKPRFNLYFKFFYGYLRLVRDFHTIPGCDIWFPLTIGLCLVFLLHKEILMHAESLESSQELLKLLSARLRFSSNFYNFAFLVLSTHPACIHISIYAQLESRTNDFIIVVM